MNIPMNYDDKSIERLNKAPLSPFEKARAEVKPRLLEDLRLIKQVLEIVEKQQPLSKAIIWGQGRNYPGRLGAESQKYQPTTEEAIVAGEVAGMAAGDEFDNFKKFHPEHNTAYLQAMLDADDKNVMSNDVTAARQAVTDGYSNTYIAPVIDDLYVIDELPIGRNDEQFPEAA